MGATSVEMQNGAVAPEEYIIDESTTLNKHADAALDFVEQHEGFSYTREEERALVRKIDWVLMPLVREMLHSRGVGY